MPPRPRPLPRRPLPRPPPPQAATPEAATPEAATPETAPAGTPAEPAADLAAAVAAADLSAPELPLSFGSEPAARSAADAPLAPLFAPPAPLFQAPARPTRGRRRAAEEPAEPAVEETAGSAPEQEAPAAAVPASPGAPAEPETAAAASTEAPTGGPDADGSDDSDDDGSRRRRRRGRRGRGRGRGADDESDDETTDSDSSDAAATADGPDESDASGDDAAQDGDAADSGPDEDSGDEEGSGSRRRRRRRRRGSGDDAGDETDPPGTVTRIRAPRERSERSSDDSDGDGVQGVRGSTRLEAKRQRRRDGRDAGRRRVPILSEAEFLARREAVDRVMVARERGDRVEIGVLEDDVLVEHFVADGGGRDGGTGRSMVGNIYLGRVQNVLPSMEAAFVDIGRGRNAVLYAGEVDWDAAGLGGKARKIEQALHSGDPVLVQVTKDPVGHKGARLTTQISLAGRFLVYVPSGGAAGISRKLPDVERKRLKDMLKEIVPSEAGVIIRTASEGVSHEALERDVRRLQAQWEVIDAKAKATGPNKPKAPVLLYEEPDLLIKVVRDQFNEDFSKLVVQGDDAWDTLHNYIGHVAPELVDRMHRHVGPKDAFAEYRIDEQLLKALDRKVWLPSGGTLVIDRTEAMTVIDVNTGKYTGSGGNLEETVTRNNLESAEEIVRQLRLRDIGGIIVIDFIDMVLESNRDLVLRRLTECLSRDRTRHQVAEVTSLGLVQMTRKRVGGGLLEHFSTTCEHCRGRGVLVDADPVPEKQPDTGRDQARPGEGRRTRGGRGRRDGEDRNGSDRNGEDRNGSDRNGSDRNGGDAHGGDADGRDRNGHAAVDTGRNGHGPGEAAGTVEVAETPAVVDVGAPAVVAEAESAAVVAGGVEDAVEEAVVERDVARTRPVAGPVLTDVDPGVGGEGDGHQARPARRRGRVTRTAGAPTATEGDSPAAVVLTVPAPETAPAPVSQTPVSQTPVSQTPTSQTPVSGTPAAQPALVPDPALAAVPPQPEPAPATTRVRRTRRAASRPAGPPPAVDPTGGGDPV
ncbi:Rne/Rng family ribonuclease [Pseudonocardia petroleophila]|uniref:Ribonuclease E n=1 Tax=Pseudonocardia petroleophila TaxID=37331 RepID=A0A7G7MQX7_9PSEU|nr:Rne/Rng family ribonuclease [Pseudonocardia petroleophila]